MNANLFHNIANGAILVGGGIGGAILASGCTQTSVGFDCSMSWLPPHYVAIGLAVIAGAKLVVNLTRDGLGGLFKPQPPVQQ